MKKQKNEPVNIVADPDSFTKDLYHRDPLVHLPKHVKEAHGIYSPDCIEPHGPIRDAFIDHAARSGSRYSDSVISKYI